MEILGLEIQYTNWLVLIHGIVDIKRSINSLVPSFQSYAIEITGLVLMWKNNLPRKCNLESSLIWACTFQAALNILWKRKKGLQLYLLQNVLINFPQKKTTQSSGAPCSYSSLSPEPQLLAATDLCSLCLWIQLPGHWTSRESPTVPFWRLTSVTSHKALLSPPQLWPESMPHPCLWLHNIPLCAWTNMCLSIHPRWTLGAIVKRPLWTFVHNLLEPPFSVLPRSRVVVLCVTGWGAIPWLIMVHF